MKDTTKKTVPTGSTIKREQSTKNNETIAPTENSAILCKSSLAYPKRTHIFKFILDKAQANIVSTQSTINSAQAYSQIPPITLSSRSVAQRLCYKRKRTTNSIEGELMVLSDITNQVPSGTTQTRQSYLTATHDERTIANTRIHSTTTPTGSKKDYQVKGLICTLSKQSYALLGQLLGFYLGRDVVESILIDQIFTRFRTSSDSWKPFQSHLQKNIRKIERNTRSPWWILRVSNQRFDFVSKSDLLPSSLKIFKPSLLLYR
ncbi:hypothetical protein YC2023_022602 [Brassica napus]